MKLDAKIFIDRALHSIQFVDYEKGQWTAPCVLTQKRFDRVMGDNSITMLKLTPLNSEVFPEDMDIGNCVSEIILDVK